MQKKEDKKLEILVSNYFAYQKEPVIPKIKRTKTKGFYTIEKLTFPSYMEIDCKNELTVMDYYKPKIKEKRPAVVVLPMIGKSHVYSKSFSKFFAKKGFYVLSVEKKNIFDIGKKNPLLHSKHVLRQMVIDTMRGIDWLVGQEYVDKEKIGITGISLGAIISSLVAANDKRIKAGVFVLGGGGLTDILSGTTGQQIKDFREKLLKKMNWTMDDFKKEFSEYIQEVEPLNYTSKLNPSKYLMINGKYDKIIMIDAAEKLWKEMGKPAFVKIPSGHYATILFLPYLNYKMFRHFKKVFGEKYTLTKNKEV